jgi:methionyl-tRNA synthetase
MGRYYLTTAIDYSNGDPHLGHALEKVGADCIARYRRLCGDQVHFLMGMDEHSQSVIAAAERGGVTPRAWVDDMADRFARFWQRLECSNDDWIRTTEPRHVAGVTALLERIREKTPGDLFEGEYEGLYCTGCEEFKTDAQMVEGHCIEHPTLDLVKTKERNWFFRLSRYQDVMKQKITSGEYRVDPEFRRNEVLRLIEDGLQDISISRQRMPWGIPFPGDPQQTVYVWFDALINYLSATGYPAAGYEKLWPADLHIVGKGITRFHCIIWPAMLLAADVALPKRVWAHGYVQWGGAKMSKTAGTVVDLETAISRHGADALRYYLLRDIGYWNDGDFTWERFDARYIADLADGLGNLASRSLAMIVRYRDGVIPDGPATTLDESAASVVASYRAAMDDDFDFAKALDAVWVLVNGANQYIVQREPWALAKAGRDADLDEVLAALARCLYRITVLVEPFIPEKAAELWRALGQNDPIDPAAFGHLIEPPTTGIRVEKPPALFPKPA